MPPLPCLPTYLPTYPLQWESEAERLAWANEHLGAKEAAEFIKTGNLSEAGKEFMVRAAATTCLSPRRLRPPSPAAR